MRIIISIVFFAISTGAGYCAASIPVLLHGDKNYCWGFLQSFTSSPLISASDKETCRLLVKPVTENIHSPDLKELSWSTYHIENVISLARYLYRSVYDPEIAGKRNGSKRLDNSELNWINSIIKINHNKNIYARKSEIKINNKILFAIELSQQKCDYQYSLDGPLPIYAFFKDKDNKIPTKMVRFPAGKLVYYHGNLSSFRAYGSHWILTYSENTETLKRIFYLSGFDVNDQGNIYGFIPSRSCAVQVTKNKWGQGR